MPLRQRRATPRVIAAPVFSPFNNLTFSMSPVTVVSVSDATTIRNLTFEPRAIFRIRS